DFRPQDPIFVRVEPSRDRHRTVYAVTGNSISLAELLYPLGHGLETYNAGHSASPTNSFCHDAGHPTHDTATEPSGSSAATSGSHDVPNRHWSSDHRHYSQMTNGGYVSGENNNAGAHDHNSYRISPDYFGSSTGALGPPEHQHPGGEIWPTALQSTTEDRHRDAAVAAGDDLSSSGPSREYIAGSGTRIVLPLEFFPYLRTGHPMTNMGTKYFPRGTTLALRSLRAKVRIRFRFRGTIY
ncbi:hypothetical protein B0H14DRAFT_2912204, partial [Mycena olivaceomarginata]